MALKLDHLNAFQRNAVLHSNGPLLILAGAGSGKTSTMAYRIAHLMTERYVSGEAILGLSFTNKAATELKERVVKIVTQHSSRKATRGLTITTFHSLCARILRAHAERLGFKQSFTILDESDQTSILRQILKNIKIDERRFDPSVILFEIGQAKNRFLNAENAEAYFLESGRLSQDYAIAAASAFPRYQEQLRILNGMDFDDLIYHTVSLLENHSEVRDQYNYKFRHILVDEYQDTNAAQFRILHLLTQKQQNLCVVGDDDQSIYAWRGADPAHILGFSRTYPEAKVISLEQNYRSTSRILEAANQVIQKNSNRYPKKLWSERGTGEPLIEVIVEEDRAEAEFVAEEILRRCKDHHKTGKDFAILYRSNAQSRVFEEALRRRQIPYKIVGGLSFLARTEVKHVLAYWRLIVNPQDDAALRRVINWPTRGIGKTTIEAIGNHAFEKTIPFFDGMKEVSRLAPKATEACYRFRDMILSLGHELAGLPYEGVALAQWAKRCLEKIEVKKALDEECEDPVQAAKKWENVEELIHSIGQFRPGEDTAPITGEMAQPDSDNPIPSDETPSSQPAEGSVSSVLVSDPTGGPTGREFLRDFLNRMTLEAQDQEKNEDRKNKDAEKNQVTLLTLHGAKGMEYPIVFLVGMEEGFLPHKRTLDEATDLSEERRLCYVGITRAKDHLFLLRAKNRVRYGKPVPRNHSRFLDDIPKDLVVRLNESNTPDLDTPMAKQEHETKVKDFLSQIRANLAKN